MRLVSYTASSDPVSRTDMLSDECQFVASSLLCVCSPQAALPVAFRIYGDEIQGCYKQQNVYSQYGAEDIMCIL
jgi:hypothetical protein